MMKNEDREALQKQLDDDLQDFIKNQVSRHKDVKEELPDIDDLARELNAHPAFIKDFDPSKPMSPAMEALQSLKYSSDSADSNAEGYKEDGNRNFKFKKYKWAIDCYTEGIKCKSADRELNCILYSNRAASNFRIKNYGSCIKDCIWACRFKPTHVKAIIKAADACFQLHRYLDAVEWCDHGLKIISDETSLLALRQKSTMMRKEQERDERKEKFNERKRCAEEKALLDVIISRGVRLENTKNLSKLSFNQLETNHPGGKMVYLSEDKSLHWPVLFLYPEYQESDLIEDFSEDQCFIDHLVVMFDKNQVIPWDKDKKYCIHKLMLMFENRSENKLYELSTDCTLQLALKHKKYVVYGGTPVFYILVRESPFAETFLSRYL